MMISKGLMSAKLEGKEGSSSRSYERQWVVASKWLALSLFLWLLSGSFANAFFLQPEQTLVMSPWSPPASQLVKPYGGTLLKNTFAFDGPEAFRAVPAVGSPLKLATQLGGKGVAQAADLTLARQVGFVGAGVQQEQQPSTLGSQMQEAVAAAKQPELLQTSIQRPHPTSLKQVVEGSTITNSSASQQQPQQQQEQSEKGEKSPRDRLYNIPRILKGFGLGAGSWMLGR